MESWGCEFLEYGDIAPPLNPKYIFLPISFLQKCVDPKKIAEIQVQDKDNLKALALHMKQNGIPGYGELTIAPNGLSLTDGNHRLICAAEANYIKFPTIIKYSTDNIKSGGANCITIMKELLEKL